MPLAVLARCHELLRGDAHLLQVLAQQTFRQLAKFLRMPENETPPKSAQERRSNAGRDEGVGTVTFVEEISVPMEILFL